MTAPIGIDPTVDYAFKRILGNPDHPNVTIHFLNSILVGQPKVRHVEYRNPILGQETDNDKLSVLDILATDNHNRKLNIEIQTSLPPGMAQRLTYYTSYLYSDQMGAGDDYPSLRPAINICVLCRSMFPKVPGLHLDFRLRDATGTILTSDLQIHLLELPKLQVTAQTVHDATPAERWAYFLRHAEDLCSHEINDLFPDREIAEAAGVLEMIARTPEEVVRYNDRVKFQRDTAWREKAWAEREAQLANYEAELNEKTAALNDKTAALNEHAAALAEREEALAKATQTLRQEGRQEARQQGELIGNIKMLQRLLGLEQSTDEELDSLGIAKLRELNDRLLKQIQSQPK